MDTTRSDVMEIVGRTKERGARGTTRGMEAVVPRWVETCAAQNDVRLRERSVWRVKVVGHGHI